MDDSVAHLLDAPTVIEHWEMGSFNHLTKQLTVEEPALLKQAKLFSSFLNPPTPKPRPVRKTQGVTPRKSPAIGRSSGAGPPARPTTVIPTFVLLATSCYPADPAKSLALINEPGRGKRWIRPGTRLGHVIVEAVDTGSIVYRDGNTRHLLAKITTEKPVPDSNTKPGSPHVTGQGETYARHVGSAKGTAKPRDVSPVRPAIKRPSFQRLGPERN